MEHYSVLLTESIETLNIKPDGIYVDGTLGRAGHSSEIVKRLTTGHLYCFDKDLEAIEKSKIRLQDHLDKVTLVHRDFCHLKEELNQRGINRIDGILLDLGVSSPQFDESLRGFSYRFDSKLDMRMDQSQALSAYEVVNEYTYEQLVSILYRYGEEKFAKQIARKIEKARELKPINTTFELVDIIKSALPSKVLSQKGHPAKQTFQAIRIEVNHELESLELALNDAISMLSIDGRACIITFHSLEDRLVKEMFLEVATPAKVDRNIPLLPHQMPKAKYRLISKKPISPSNQELDENKRSHSAKLRVLERIEE